MSCRFLPLSLLLVVLLSVCISCNRGKQEAANNHSEQIQRIENSLQRHFQVVGEPVDSYAIEERMEVLGIPGLSICVAIDGKIAWSRAYGMADISKQVPMNVGTLLLAGSVSKPVSAVRAHQLVEEGRLSLDENVNDYLVRWKVPDNEFTEVEKVTLRRILNHTAGLTVWGFPGYDKGDAIPSVVEVLDGEGNTGPVRVYKEPGESWMYSGGGYTIMQLLIEDVESRPFDEVLQQHVLRPLGMSMSTFTNPLPDSLHRLAATGYRRNMTEVEGKWPIYPEMAAAGLWTTPSQLVEYGLAIQKIKQTGKDGILGASTVTEMLTPGMNGHGLGPGVNEDESWWGHGGADEGFRTNLQVSMEGGSAIAVMVNSDLGVIINELISAVAVEYGWVGFEPQTRERGFLEEWLLAGIAGSYEFAGRDPIQVSVEKDYLRAKADWISEDVALYPENDSTFFDKLDGQTIKFRYDEDSILTMVINEQLVGTRRN